jgi:hypothetical protein
MKLTPKEKKLYCDLLLIFNESGLYKIATFESFLELKYEGSGCKTTYWNVWQYERNNH